MRPPGGEVEFGERAEDAVRREFREELGADVSVLGQIGVMENLFLHEGARGHEVVFLFLVALPDGYGPCFGPVPVREEGVVLGGEWVALEGVGRSGGPVLLPEGLAGFLTGSLE